MVNKDVYITSLQAGRPSYLPTKKKCQRTEGKTITVHGLVHPKLSRGSSIVVNGVIAE